MIALLGKDLRLSLDALRPWATVAFLAMLVVVGLALAPKRVADLLFGVDRIDSAPIGPIAWRFLFHALFWTSVPVALFLGVAVGVGDRVHGAKLLAAVLPTRRRHRTMAILIATAGGALVPAGVTVGVAFVVSHWDRAVEMEGWFPLWLLLASSLAAAGVGLALACAFEPRTSTRWHVWVLGAALLAVSALVGGLAGPYGIPLVDPALAIALDGPAGTETRGEQIQRAAFFAGALAGVIALGGVAWCLAALWQVGRSRGASRHGALHRGLLIAVAAALVVGLGGALAGVANARETTAAWSIPSYAAFRVQAMSLGDIVEVLHRDRQRWVRGGDGAPGTENSYAWSSESGRVTLMLDHALSLDGPKRLELVHEIRSLQSIESPALAFWSLRRTPINDDSWARLALLAVERWPEDRRVTEQLLHRFWPGVLRTDPRDSMQRSNDRLIREMLPVFEALATDPPDPAKLFEGDVVLPNWQRDTLLAIRLDTATRAELQRLLPLFRERAARVPRRPRYSTPTDYVTPVAEEGAP